MMYREVGLFGIKPTGQPHIANYLCLISTIRKSSLIVCFVANLHSLSEGYMFVPRLMNRLMVAFYVSVFSTRSLLSQCIVYVQSSILLSPYLNWIIVCLSRTNDVNHASSSSTLFNLGSLLYPSLMTADIVLCKPTYLCVGLDQARHIEYTNAIIARLNRLFRFRVLERGHDFVVGPQRSLRMLKVMSIKDPYRKMSKSDNSSAISMLDDYLSIRTKVCSAKTDCVDNMVVELNKLHNRSGLLNLVNIYSFSIGISNPALLGVINLVSVGVFKSLLKKLVYYRGRNVRGKVIRYLGMPGSLDKVVASGRH